MSWGEAYPKTAAGVAVVFFFCPECYMSFGIKMLRKNEQNAINFSHEDCGD